jgi:outer membrane protein OmpA-like peptidoglycan-associated protein
LTNEAVARQIESVTSGEKPLPPAVQSFFEPRFGRDFSDVSVHTDSKADEAARSIDAEAFTHGNDIVFKSGAYRPNTEGGRELLAHELTHVVQQGHATDAGTTDTVQRQDLKGYSSGGGDDSGDLVAVHRDTGEKVTVESGIQNQYAVPKLLGEGEYRNLRRIKQILAARGYILKTQSQVDYEKRSRMVKLPTTAERGVLAKIYFPTGSAELSQNDRSVLSMVKRRLLGWNPAAYSVQMEGHADRQLFDSDNDVRQMSLAMARADAVKTCFERATEYSLLTSQNDGIPTVSFGAEGPKPSAVGDPIKELAEYRRVDVRIFEKEVESGEMTEEGSKEPPTPDAESATPDVTPSPGEDVPPAVRMVQFFDNLATWGGVAASTAETAATLAGSTATATFAAGVGASTAILSMITLPVVGLYEMGKDPKEEADRAAGSVYGSIDELLEPYEKLVISAERMDHPDAFWAGHEEGKMNMFSRLHKLEKSTEGSFEKYKKQAQRIAKQYDSRERQKKEIKRMFRGMSKTEKSWIAVKVLRGRDVGEVNVHRILNDMWDRLGEERQIGSAAGVYEGKALTWPTPGFE